VVRQAAFLEHDGDLAAVGRAPGIEFDHVEVAGDGFSGVADSIGGDAALAAVSPGTPAGRFPDPGAWTDLLHPVRDDDRAHPTCLGARPAAVAARRSRA